MSSFTYSGPFEIFVQEGGFASPGIRQIDDGEGGTGSPGSGFITQLTVAGEKGDLITTILQDLGVELRESVVLGGPGKQITITVTTAGEESP